MKIIGTFLLYYDIIFGMNKRIANTISVFEFIKMFPDEASARKFLINKRCGSQIDCPYCSHKHITELKREGFFRCKKCDKVFSVKTGTFMERSKIEIRTWLFAMYYIVTARKSVSSLQFSKEVGITQKTAWFLLHRIREAMTQEDTSLLSGIVEDR